MRWWERAVIAAASIVVGWAFLVLFLVGLKGVEDWKRDRVKRLATQRIPRAGGVGYETAPAGASTPSGGLTAPSRFTERNG